MTSYIFKDDCNERICQLRLLQERMDADSLMADVMPSYILKEIRRDKRFARLHAGEHWLVEELNKEVEYTLDLLVETYKVHYPYI